MMTGWIKQSITRRWTGIYPLEILGCQLNTFWDMARIYSGDMADSTREYSLRDTDDGDYDAVDWLISFHPPLHGDFSYYKPRTS